MATIHDGLSAVAVIVCAFFSGILTFLSARPWRWPVCILWPIGVLFLYFAIIAATSVCWLHPNISSKVSLWLLFETTWLAGVYPQGYLMRSICPDDRFKKNFYILYAIALSLKIIGFAISQSPQSELYDRSFTFAGIFIFHLVSAIGFYCIFVFTSLEWRMTVVPLIVFSLATVSVILIELIIHGSPQQPLAINLLECSTNIALFLCKLVRRVLLRSDLETAIRSEKSFGQTDAQDIIHHSQSHEQIHPSHPPQSHESLHPSQSHESLQLQSYQSHDISPRTETTAVNPAHPSGLKITGIRELLNIEQNSTVTAEVLVDLDGNNIGLLKIDWDRIQEWDSILKELMPEDMFKTVTQFSTPYTLQPIFCKWDIQDLVPVQEDCKVLRDGGFVCSEKVEL